MNNNQNLRKAFQNLAQNTNEHLLNLMIKQHTININMMRKLKDQIEANLKAELIQQDIEELIASQNKFIENTRNNLKTSQTKKFKTLIDHNDRNNQLIFNEKCLINLIPDLDIPTEVKTILSYGPKFGLPINKGKLPTLGHTCRFRRNIK